MGSDYQFLTVWRVAGTVEEVKAVLNDGKTLPEWWPSVYLDVREVEPGRPDGLGRVFDLHTKGWLPYTLRWTVRITEPVTDAGFALEASGDLEGTGRWTFEQDGPEVIVTYDWRISATKPLLRRLSWLLRPAFSANHHWAMKRGEESLALEIRRRRAATEEERGTVPPPSPPTFRWLLGNKKS
ncbi:MAG: polyketide cyclase [Actinomycetota bacterium]|nr:polyketide cyclase [Actinomycetota bacterium]